MTRSLRIAVADDEPDVREYFQSVLPALGHEVVALAETGRQLVQRCAEARPDLVITDIKMPDMDGIEAAEQIYRDGPVPVILVTGQHSPELLGRAEEGQVMAYLVKPIKRGDLEPAIVLAVRRFEELQASHREAAGLRQALEERKLIERAKGILMRRLRVDEDDAFRRLRMLASSQNRKVVEVSRQVTAADEVFQQLEAVR